MPKITVTLQQAAHQLSVSRSMIYRLIAAGQLRSVHVGGRHLIPVAALTALVGDAQ
jgi:excisionase family DNA binding protein